MKTAGNNTQPNKQAASKKARPENKDNLDSHSQKVKGKDNTAKTDKNTTVKTKNPGKQKSVAKNAETKNAAPKKAAKKKTK
jgi:hypothetical protein